MPLRAPSFWYKKPSAQSALLCPLAAVYSLGRMVHGLMRPDAYKASIPVICIGNITAGGSGKTPTALALLDLIKREGIAKAPAFLTRGYGGTVKDAVLVDGHTASAVGDEALLLAARAPTIVSADRAAGAHLAETHGADMIIMDDGFQNQGLHKDVNLLVVNGAMGFGNGKLLPAGPLREPVAEGLARADAVIMIGEDVHKLGVSAVKANLKPVSTFDKDTKYLAFAGLGYPQKFFDFLTHECGLKIEQTRSFADHHPYSAADIEELQNSGLRLITTAKDRLRLPEDLEVDVMNVELVFENTDSLVELLRGAK